MSDETFVPHQFKDHASNPSTIPCHLQLTRSAHKVIPHLYVSNIEEAAEFYTKALHFELGGLHLDPETRMASVAMGEKAVVNVYLFEVRDWSTKTKTRKGEREGQEEEDDAADNNVQQKQEIKGRIPPEAGSSCIMIGLGRMELEQYYHVLKDEGKVTITYEIDDKPWEFRQFEIVDQDGNAIQFWAFLDDGDEE